MINFVRENWLKMNFKTKHKITNGDCRQMSELEDKNVKIGDAVISKKVILEN